ncbi:late embryogenesis abundant protein At1g64065-like [Rhododendron vialii]|uniref:late embryogenesis abundant protein At1g64065-like n=1 Tax=Rhododendron vialii TaxID=182163 RepID=UPI00265FA882|nr:late embryogenesis abundant protein At1g64065-like [Rhododendron vialii]
MAREFSAGYPSAAPSELRRQHRKKLLLYGVAFVIFLTGIIVLLSTTVLRIRTPQFQLRSATVDAFNSTINVQGTSFPEKNNTTTPSFNARIKAVLAVQNTNYGPYKYEKSTIYFFFDGTPVGSAEIPGSKAGSRSTEIFNVAVSLADQAGNNSQLENYLTIGFLPLTSRSTLNGKVELIIKKKKTVNLDCAMDIDILDKDPFICQTYLVDRAATKLSRS